MSQALMSLFYLYHSVNYFVEFQIEIITLEASSVGIRNHSGPGDGLKRLERRLIAEVVAELQSSRFVHPRPENRQL